MNNLLSVIKTVGFSVTVVVLVNFLILVPVSEAYQKRPQTYENCVVSLVGNPAAWTSSGRRIKEIVYAEKTHVSQERRDVYLDGIKYDERQIQSVSCGHE